MSDPFANLQKAIEQAAQKLCAPDLPVRGVWISRVRNLIEDACKKCGVFTQITENERILQQIRLSVPHGSNIYQELDAVKRIREAATTLYRSSFWESDRLDSDVAAKYWENLRAACGIAPGQSPKPECQPGKMSVTWTQVSGDTVTTGGAAQATYTPPVKRWKIGGQWYTKLVVGKDTYRHGDVVRNDQTGDVSQVPEKFLHDTVFMENSFRRWFC